MPVPAHDDAPGRVHPALSFVDVTKSFGPVAVLRGVSFDVRPGEIHGLLGANGAGKPTLIRHWRASTGVGADTLAEASHGAGTGSRP